MRHGTGRRVARRFGASAAIGIAVVGLVAGFITAAAIALIGGQQ